MPDITKITLSPSVEIEFSHSNHISANVIVDAIPQIVKTAAEVINSNSRLKISTVTIAIHDETAAKISFFQEDGRIVIENIIQLSIYQRDKSNLNKISLDNNVLKKAQNELSKITGTELKLIFKLPETNTTDIVENSVSTQIILYSNVGDPEQILTPEYLRHTVTPYLSAIADIKHILDEIKGKTNYEIKIKSISQNSPISVSLDGASQAIQTIVDYAVPWKRKYAEEIARLSISEKQADIENKRAEVLEKRARATKDRAESEKLLVEIDTKKVEAVRMELENDKLRLELKRAKIQMALDILKEIAPNISETEKIEYILKLLPPLDVVILSNLDLQTGK